MVKSFGKFWNLEKDKRVRRYEICLEKLGFHEIENGMILKSEMARFDRMSVKMNAL